MSRLRLVDQRRAVLPAVRACATVARNMAVPPDVRKVARACGRMLLEATSSFTQRDVTAPDDLKRLLQFRELHEPVE